MEKIISDVKTLWAAVSAQGVGLQALEALVGRIKNAVNSQAQGLRNAENRISQLEALLMNSVQRAPQQRPQMRTVNQMQRAPLRALPSSNARPDFVAVDDPSADYETEDEEEGEFE